MEIEAILLFNEPVPICPEQDGYWKGAGAGFTCGGISKTRNKIIFPYDNRVPPL